MKVDKVAGNIALTEYVSPDPGKTPISLLAPMNADSNVDVNMIPEAWDFKFNKKNTGWDEAPVYELNTSPTQDGLLVIRRYVADKIARIPAEIEAETINVKFQPSSGETVASRLPEGAELAVVTAEGFTYSAPIKTDSNGVSTARIADLKPRKGVIMPAPYPVMMTRESPASTARSRDSATSSLWK